MLKYLSAGAFAVLSGVALTIGGTLSGTQAQAVPIPGVPAESVLHTRLAIVGADRPDAAVLGAQVCSTLRADPTPNGKRAARRQLAGAGVAPGVQEGWVLGTSVDVLCPEFVPVLRA
ncbi:hypothetical protein ACWCPQ_13005 [Nocardia sp. NPDC001965]